MTRKKKKWLNEFSYSLNHRETKNFTFIFSVNIKFDSLWYKNVEQI
jgi:hypothetical protein